MQEKNIRIDIHEIAQQVLRGALVVYPTETFFALGCNAFDLTAVRHLFHVKKRSMSQPLPLIVSSIRHAKEITSHIDDISFALMEQFWPGSLTLILPAAESIPSLITAQSGSVALRVSSHATAQNIVETCGVPLVSSSANISGMAPVVCASDLDTSLLAHTPIVIDEGAIPNGGLPSTIVQVKNKKVCIQREGVVKKNDLQRAGFQVG